MNKNSIFYELFMNFYEQIVNIVTGAIFDKNLTIFLGQTMLWTKDRMKQKSKPHPTKSPNKIQPNISNLVIQSTH